MTRSSWDLGGALVLAACLTLITGPEAFADESRLELDAAASDNTTAITGYTVSPETQQIVGAVHVAGQERTAVLYTAPESIANDFMCMPLSDTEVLQIDCRSPLPFTAASGTPLPVSATVTARDVERLIASGSGASRQPPGGQVLLSKPLIVYTDPSPRTLTTTVAGIQVELHLTPVSYTWDWGDGSSTTTTDPGATYPDQSVTHYYSATATNVVVTLTTRWDARFRPTGATAWQPVTGQVTTTDHAAPFDIVRRVTVLTDTAEELQGH